MYILWLIIISSLFISLFSTNWPVKLAHYFFLRKLAMKFGVKLAQNSFFSSGADSKIDLILLGKEIKVRFLEGTVDSLYTNSGLELRIKIQHFFIIQFYRPLARKYEWGEFKQVLSGATKVDSQWFILSPQPEQARQFIEENRFIEILKISQIDQILIEHDETIIQLRRIFSVGQFKALLEKLASAL